MSCTEFKIEWRNRALTVRYFPSRWNGSCDHIEIESDNGISLPITETGYKSHFVPKGTVTSENVCDAVIDWLDREASKQGWKDHEANARQMNLF